MELYRELKAYQSNAPSAVALGTFDGLHIGHIEVISELNYWARKKNLKSLVYTFENHPMSLTAPEREPDKLMTVPQKIDAFKKEHIDGLLLLPFDNYQRDIDPERFIKEVLVDHLSMKHLVVGHDYRFGKGAEGDVRLIEQLAPVYGYDFTILSAIKKGEIRISSTLIRALLRQGKIREANLFLGRYYSIIGEVVRGKEIGRKIGFPTANLKITSNMTLLKPGVYITRTNVDGILYPSVTNVGYNPTFRQNQFNLETHILQFEEDLYGRTIEVIFIARLRDEHKLDSVDELIRYIASDVEKTLEYFNLPFTRAEESDKIL